MVAALSQCWRTCSEGVIDYTAWNALKVWLKNVNASREENKKHYSNNTLPEMTALIDRYTSPRILQKFVFLRCIWLGISDITMPQEKPFSLRYYRKWMDYIIKVPPEVSIYHSVAGPMENGSHYDMIGPFESSSELNEVYFWTYVTLFTSLYYDVLVYDQIGC